jgi:membrane protein implicated in regulation of membrane protease activity
MKTQASKSSEDSSPKTPRWETLVIAASFAGVWIYFFAWIAAGRAKAPLSVWWQFLLVPCLIALVVVFRRRLARAKNTVRESNRPGFGR